MSRKAVTSPSLCTIVPGISPATILQNRQSASAIDQLSFYAAVGYLRHAHAPQRVWLPARRPHAHIGVGQARAVLLEQNLDSRANQPDSRGPLAGGRQR